MALTARSLRADAFPERGSFGTGGPLAPVHGVGQLQNARVHFQVPASHRAEVNVELHLAVGFKEADADVIADGFSVEAEVDEEDGGGAGGFGDSSEVRDFGGEDDAAAAQFSGGGAGG